MSVCKMEGYIYITILKYRNISKYEDFINDKQNPDQSLAPLQESYTLDIVVQIIVFKYDCTITWRYFKPPFVHDLRYCRPPLVGVMRPSDIKLNRRHKVALQVEGQRT